jgi:citronellol/citronellal dehydrogenase
VSRGMAEEFQRDGIGVNALWPRNTVIDTAALPVIPELMHLRNAH